MSIVLDDERSTLGMYYALVRSPLGTLTLVASSTALVALLWPDDNPRRVRHGARQRDDRHPILSETANQLAEYFAGRRRSFDLPLEFHGTPFQRDVWSALLEIPYGETRSYSDIARDIGNPKATRAVGAANGRNPLSIVAPCHRVVGSSGKLTGFAGGLEAKSWLLTLEKSRPSSADTYIDLPKPLRDRPAKR